jgi:hypothetical protein
MYIGTTLPRLAEPRFTVPFKCFVPSDRAVMVLFIMTVVSILGLTIVYTTRALPDIIAFDADVAINTGKLPCNLSLSPQSLWHPPSTSGYCAAYSGSRRVTLQQ